MSVEYEGGVAGNRAVKLTTNTVTDIVDGSEAFLIKAVYVTEIAGATPNFSLEVYDGTTSVYLQKTKTVTALQTQEWGDIPLNSNQKLRATASAANQIDVFAVVVELKR